MDKLEITYRGVIYPWQCDHMGHMNVMWYTGKFDEASWYLLARAGLTPTFLQSRKCGLAAVQQNTTYRRELRAGDVITIRSGILEIQDKSLQMFHEMRKDETQVVAAFTFVTGVYMDTLKRKACPVPSDVRERLDALRLNQNELYWEDTFTSGASRNSIG